MNLNHLYQSCYNASEVDERAKEFAILFSGFFFKKHPEEIQQFLLKVGIVIDLSQIETYQSIMKSIYNETIVLGRRFV